MQSMTADELVKVDLCDAERQLVTRGLAEWGGPAHCTDALAIAMGFDGVRHFYTEARRLSTSIRTGQPLTATDWRRALIATEIVFASDVFGSGCDWSSTTGLTDEGTIGTLRALQRKLAGAANVHNV